MKLPFTNSWFKSLPSQNSPIGPMENWNFLLMSFGLVLYLCEGQDNSFFLKKLVNMGLLFLLLGFVDTKATFT